jgi:hypothetical protein
VSIYVDGRGGTLILDRRIRKVGRIKQATGLPDTEKGRDKAASYDEMIDVLMEGGRIDVVRAVQAGALAFQDVWPHYRTGNWALIATAESMKPLFPLRGKKPGAAGAWIPKARTASGKPISEAHRADLWKSFIILERKDKRATVALLPKLLGQLREECIDAETPRKFNKAKAHIQAFLRSTQGKRRSHLWADVADIANLEERRKDGHPQPPAKALEIRRKLPGAHGAIWWTMCCTGMGWGELNGKWYAESDRVHIMGTKREGRDRMVPRIGTPEKPLRGYKAFRTALEDVDETLVPYDGRRTFAHWLEEAGVPRTRRRIYLGHKVKDVTDLYEGHDVTHYIPDDRAKLLTYLEGVL